MNTATLRIVGEYERIVAVEPGIDDGWYVFLHEDDEQNDWINEFVYDSNAIKLYRDGNEMAYGTYDIEFN